MTRLHWTADDGRVLRRFQTEMEREARRREREDWRIFLLVLLGFVSLLVTWTILSHGG